LQQALRAGRAVPPDFVAAARCAFAWRDIDVELARLSYDSPGELNQAGRPPAETASLHTLSFRSGLLSIVLEVGRDCLIGQILPAQPALLRVQGQHGSGPGHPLRRARLLHHRAHPARTVPPALHNGRQHRRPDPVDQPVRPRLGQSRRPVKGGSPARRREWHRPGLGSAALLRPRDRSRRSWTCGPR
jgi:hypothetical protein